VFITLIFTAKVN